LRPTLYVASIAMSNEPNPQHQTSNSRPRFLSMPQVHLGDGFVY